MSKTVAEIIDLYINFFKEKGHSHIPSSSLLPKGDPSLLFTTAGMVQFKPLFTGAVDLPYTRAVTVQKCLRTSDLENVGKTERHCTFFEMLGNFSFGDYFKKEAIAFAWDFSVNYIKFPREKIWTTVYLDDDEAVSYWREIGVPARRIVRLGKKDNFWGPAGDSGACGPSTELYLDRGIDKGCGKSDCKPGCDCDRFMEYWNLVFNQFNQDTEGKLHPLKQTGIDTGAGVERFAVLLQGVDSVYDTDELKRIIQFVEKLSGIKYSKINAPSFRVIADHSRAVMFALADGISPDRTGRGYVIRRLIRRSALFARKIGLMDAFLFKLVDELIAIYHTRYPVVEQASIIKRTIQMEEELFLTTLEKGLSYLEEILLTYKNSDKQIFSGKDAFMLYGTYGFPVEMTIEIAEENGLAFDIAGFEEELEKDRELSRESWTGKKVSYASFFPKGLKTEFTGYTEDQFESAIVMIFKDEKQAVALAENEDGVIITDKTPFYAESGGQLGDSGEIISAVGVFMVYDTQKENDVFLHYGKVISGSLSVKTNVTLKVNTDRRTLLASHHSGTHLLNGALRKALGNHVTQKASLVSPDYLRFDFSHAAQLQAEEIEKIETLVNQAINKAIKVTTRELPIAEAKKTGAVAAFDEKYGDVVRVVSMDDTSVEFCGGIHVKNTKDIGYFTIVKESSPGAGNRRIEAVCNGKVREYFIHEFELLQKKANEFNSRVNELPDNAELIFQKHIPDIQEIDKAFSEQNANIVLKFKNEKEEIEKALSEKNSFLHKHKKKLEQSELKENTSLAKELFDQAEKLGDFLIVTHIFNDQNLETLKDLGDQLKSRAENVIVLFANKSDKVTFIFMCAKKLADEKKVHCGNLVKDACELSGGKGGGRPDFAQGGGSIVANAEEAMKQVILKIHSIKV